MYKLMLVDDQRIIMEGIVKLIQQMNLPFDQFVFAENGSQALEMLETENPDAVITDIRMPVMDGLEMARRIRARKDEFREMPILILTGYDEFEYARQAITHKILFYLLKPVSKDELYASCRMMMDMLEERRSQMNDRVSRMNFREHVIRDTLHWSDSGPAPERHPEGMLLVQIRTEGDRKSFYQRAGELRETLKERLYAAYIRDTEVYFLLTGTEFTEEVQGMEINLSKPFFDLADLPEAVRQIYQVHLRRESLQGQRILSFSDIQNAKSILPLVDLSDMRQLWNAMEQGEQETEQALAALHQEILKKSKHSRSEASALYTVVCMEIYKRYFSIPLARECQDEFDLLLHSGAMFIQEEPEKIRQAVTRAVCRISEKLGKKQEENIILKAKKLIHERPEWSLNELAEALHISSGYLSTLYHKETGKPLGDTLIQERILKACNLLCTTRYTVEQIARQVGYTSEKHFFVVFKKNMGVSPARYRKEHHLSGV